MNKSNRLGASAKRNALAYYFFFAINAICSFFVSPILLEYLGPHSFGLWKSAQKILDFASVADGRSTQALKSIIANQECSDNYDKKKRAVSAALRVWLYFSPILLVVTSALVYFLPALINGVSTSDVDTLLWVGVALGVNIVLAPVVGIPDAVLMGVNQGYKSILSQGFWLVFSTIGMAGVAYTGYGVVGVAVVFTVMALLNGVSVLYLAVKGVSWFGCLRPQSGEVKSFFNFSGWVLLWTVVERGLLSLELILLGVFFGATEVTQYTFSSFVVQFGAGIALLTGSAVTPGLGKLVGMKDKSGVERAVEIFREFMLFVMVSLASGLLLLNEFFVQLWVGPKVFMGFWENVTIALLLLQLIHIRSESQLQDLSLSIKSKVLAGLGTTALSAFFCALFREFFPLRPLDVLLLVFASRLPLNYYIPILVNKKLQLPSPVRGKVFAGLILLMSVAISYFVSFNSSRGGFVLSSTAWLLFAIGGFFFLLGSSSREKLLLLIRRTSG